MNSFIAYSQPNKTYCHCASTDEKIFKVDSQKTLLLCGGKDSSLVKGKTLYSEFTIRDCNTDKIIYEAGADQWCNVYVQNKHLLVSDIKYLPVTKIMNYQYVLWKNTTFTPKGLIYLRNEKLSDAFPKYSGLQIQKVLELYKTTPDTNTQTTAELADKLLVSAISGSTKAKTYLLNFKKKYKSLDGDIAESYDNDLALYNEWKNKHK